nr:unnamed protein product [Callosobruchus analis]
MWSTLLGPLWGLEAWTN